MFLCENVIVNIYVVGKFVVKSGLLLVSVMIRLKFLMVRCVSMMNVDKKIGVIVGMMIVE